MTAPRFEGRIKDPAVAAAVRARGLEGRVHIEMRRLVADLFEALVAGGIGAKRARELAAMAPGIGDNLPRAVLWASDPEPRDLDEREEILSKVRRFSRAEGDATVRKCSLLTLQRLEELMPINLEAEP